MLRLLWPLLLMLSLSLPAFPSLSQSRDPFNQANQREPSLRRSLVRDADFSAIRHVSAQPDCEEVQAPQAITTPDPLWIPSREHTRVTISFIVGTDGRVHSPLILESAGARGDHRVLQTVRSWRFRPATCNGVPTETEGKVEFSSR
jgi:TonB family protein